MSGEANSLKLSSSEAAVMCPFYQGQIYCAAWRIKLQGFFFLVLQLERVMASQSASSHNLRSSCPDCSKWYG